MKNNYIETAEQSLLHTYNRYQIVLEKGEGDLSVLTQKERNNLDFAAGIAVCSLGYGHPKYTEGLKQQMEKLLHTSNLFYSVPSAKAAEHLRQVSCMDRVIFYKQRNRGD